MTRTLFRVLTLAAAAVGLAPATAGAAVTCSFDAANARLSIASATASDDPGIVRSGLAIVVRSGDAVVGCSGPPATVTNTDKIAHLDSTPTTTRFTVDLGGGPLAPGKTGEGQFGTAEIEIEVDAGSADDLLRVLGTSAADTLRAGTSAGDTRVNLNVGEAIEDADITGLGVDRVSVAGLAGDDRLDGRGGAGTGDPLAVPSVLVGDGQDDELFAGAQPSILDGGGGHDRLLGGAKRDNIWPGMGHDQVDGQDGTDVLWFADSTPGAKLDLLSTVKQDTGEGLDQVVRVEDVLGTPGDDVLRGDNEVNRLSSVGGDDVIEGRGGGDIIEGGLGKDVASYASAGGSVTVDLAAPAPQASGAGGLDVLDEIESVTGGSSGDTLAGDGGPNALDGSGGTDVLDGRGGADLLDGGRGTGEEADGADLLDGGPGTDTLSYARRLGDVSITLDGLPNDGAPGEGDQDEALESATGGAGDDKLFTPGTNVNVLSGGLGDDWLAGGFGADRLDGGGGTDTMSYEQRASRVAVRLDGVRNDGEDPDGDGTSGEGEERDLDVSIERASGGSGNDRLRATGDVDNRLEGRGGADVLDGGPGTDVLDGGPGSDTISYAARATRVAVTLNGLADDGADPDKDASSSPAEEGDQDVAIEHATGGSGHDFLRAQQAAINVLTGGPGNDRLDAGDGSAVADQLDCGTGALDVMVKDPADAAAGCEELAP